MRRTCGRSAARAGEMRPRSAVAGVPSGPSPTLLDDLLLFLETGKVLLLTLAASIAVDSGFQRQ